MKIGTYELQRKDGNVTVGCQSWKEDEFKNILLSLAEEFELNKVRKRHDKWFLLPDWNEHLVLGDILVATRSVKEMDYIHNKEGKTVSKDSGKYYVVRGDIAVIKKHWGNLSMVATEVISGKRSYPLGYNSISEIKNREPYYVPYLSVVKMSKISESKMDAFENSTLKVAEILHDRRPQPTNLKS